MKTSIRSYISNYAAVIIILVWALAPFYWMVVTAFRDKAHTFSTNPFPSHLTLENFREAMATDAGNNFLRAIGSSLIIASPPPPSPCSWACSPPPWPGGLPRQGIRQIILAASMFPGIAWSPHCSSCSATSARSAPTRR